MLFIKTDTNIGRNQELPTLRFSSNSQDLEIVDQFLGEGGYI